MRLPFNEVKATQAAAFLLTLRGGQMSYMKLIKLLYLADRESLLKHGHPITTDRWVSMDNGPVVSRIYELIREEPQPGIDSFWQRHIAPAANYEVKLAADAGDDELSPAEIDVLQEIFERHGRSGRWELVEYSRTLPEWHDPDGSSIPISVEDILSAGGWPADEIEEVVDELQHLAYMSQLRSPR
jgi:uncharacterized phage-associated protein